MINPWGDGASKMARGSGLGFKERESKVQASGLAVSRGNDSFSNFMQSIK
jgi:hypothetical protein